MNIKEYTTTANLEKYSFWWSEARLVIAAVALFLGGIPPVKYILGSSSYGLVSNLLVLAWIISGVVAGYLLYMWTQNGQKLFGGKEKMDLYAFFVMIISGINLGLTGLMGSNIGMSISTNTVVFWIVGLLYIATGYHLHKRWKENGEKIF